MLAKVILAEHPQLFGREFPRTRKILLLQHALDPDVDRECAQPFVREEHHAISNFGAYSGQIAKPGAQLSIRQVSPRLQVGFATHNPSRRSE